MGATRGVTFVQYSLPDGRATLMIIDRPEDIVVKAEKLVQEHQCRLEIEILRTGEVSMTIERNTTVFDEDSVMAHEICANGPSVIRCVDTLISKAYILATSKGK